ncbi:hypothetical protein CgunFtcFv8_013636 [Champsocephalus gunnari]|uniref:Uncharacterized protein n=1 Tax=Champsocephalus gunnari TaxID=52237 RepID=A0AAN8HV09_CHAGU|nr:hypothetical protein CgunFtcFv8_013636 [Champsocephalus gunnari]
MVRCPSVVDSNPHVSQVSKPLPVPPGNEGEEAEGGGGGSSVGCCSSERSIVHSSYQPPPSCAPSPLQRRRLPAAEAYPDDRLPSPAASPAQAPCSALDPPLPQWSLYPPRDRL